MTDSSERIDGTVEIVFFEIDMPPHVNFNRIMGNIQMMEGAEQGEGEDDTIVPSCEQVRSF